MSMKRLIGLEWYKLIRSRLFWGILAYMVLVTVFFLNGGAEELEGWPAMGKEVLSFVNGPAWFVFPVYIEFIYAAVLLFDFRSGYIKDMITYGYSKNTIYLSRYAGFAIGSVILNLVFPVQIFAMVTAQNGYGEPVGGKTVLYLAGMLILMILQYIVLAGIVFAIMFVVKNVLAVIFGLFFINFFMVMLSVSRPEILKWTIFGVGLEFGEFSFTPAAVLKIFVVFACALAAGFGVGIPLFNRHEWK